MMYKSRTILQKLIAAISEVVARYDLEVVVGDTFKSRGETKLKLYVQLEFSLDTFFQINISTIGDELKIDMQSEYISSESIELDSDGKPREKTIMFDSFKFSDSMALQEFLKAVNEMCPL